MDKDIRAIFAISDSKYQTKHNFTVVLGKKSGEELEKEIKDEFAKCVKKNRISILFDDSMEDEFECERIDSPFYYGAADYLEVNNELIEINYYSNENEKFLEELMKRDVLYSEMYRELLKNKL